MIVRGRDFADIYDLVGVRILVESVRDCYAVLGVVHSKWSPVPGRFKDFIAMPKFNMYQSLHTTVIGPEGKPVELQIRTQDMHRSAEFGVAAHWRYKQQDVAGKAGPDDFGWLRQLLEWQRETEDPDEFLDSLRYDLGSSEVFVFTPKGDVVALPTKATPVDFAYTVHTEVGHRCVGARVNGKLVPLESTLENGDVVEIFTSKADGAGPSRDWLGFVQSPRARSKIKAWFSRERRDEAIEHGKDAIVRAMRKQGLPLQRMMTNQALSTIAADLHQADISALYASVGEGRISAATIVQRLVDSAGGVDGAADDAAEVVSPTTPALASAGSRRRRRHRQGRRRRLGEAGPLLHAGAGRRDHRLRHARGGGVGAPHRLRERAGAAGGAGPHGRGRVGADVDAACSSSTSRWRPSTGPACSRTSRAPCPTRT